MRLLVLHYLYHEISDQIWDITSLAQSNIANGNHTLSIMLKTIGSAGSSHLFYDNSNSDKRPELRLNYVDNVDGVIPPAQPVLTFPADGDVLYNTSAGNLTHLTNQYSWNSVANATDMLLQQRIRPERRNYSWESQEINEQHSLSKTT